MTVVDHEAERLDRAAAEALAGRICARAAEQAVASCQLLELIGEFDAGGGVGWMSGVKSVAHWVAFSCSMSPGAAREHVRVARAMRRMPTITAAFRAGELSYSKMREVTRVVGLVDEPACVSWPRRHRPRNWPGRSPPTGPPAAPGSGRRSCGGSGWLSGPATA
ncbi:DUF222 domain-containing protein [Microlunatus parietis]|uniref:DUF222 domain-containing protein n=1 Tax=Microlunatus parietis TaxID=682979 RepID=A0A7Y9IAY2_9ACTN|nr:DUF222 domain-containing protein [Microlunatus parietis]NYE73024.1 hypothetical protein [Microlunatus parietis]